MSIDNANFDLENCLKFSCNIKFGPWTDALGEQLLCAKEVCIWCTFEDKLTWNKKKPC